MNNETYLQYFDWYLPNDGLWWRRVAAKAEAMKRVGITGVWLPPQNLEPVANLPRLIMIRTSYAYGDQVDYLDDDHIVGWVRKGNADHPDSGLAVVMSGNVGGVKRMNMGKEFAGRVFHDALDKCTDAVTIDADGWGNFETAGGNVAVWVLQIGEKKAGKAFFHFVEALQEQEEPGHGSFMTEGLYAGDAGHCP